MPAVLPLPSPLAAQGLFEDPILLIALGVLALLIWFLVRVIRGDRKQVANHMAALGAYAKEHGYGYEPLKVEDFEKRFPTLPQFEMGRSSEISSVVSRTQGMRPFWAGNLRVFVGSAGGSTGARRTTISVLAMSSSARLGILSLRPRGFFARLMGPLARADMQTGDAAFDRVYHISTPHLEWGALLLGAETRSALMRFPPRRLVLRDGHIRVVRVGLMGVETLKEYKQIAEILLDAAEGAEAGVPAPQAN